jgi:uncharacterized delta-60 repeat protein
LRGIAATPGDEWLDQSFGGGMQTLDLSPGKDVPAGVAVQDDGKVVVAATVDRDSQESDINVLRFLPNGTPDEEFATNGRFVLHSDTAAWALGLRVQPDGRIVVAGRSASPSGTGQLVVMRLDGAGRLDPAFAGGVVRVDLQLAGFDTVGVSALALAPDGKIVVAGAVSKSNVSAPVVIRLDSNGGLDQGFGDHGFATRRLASSSQWWSEGATSVAVRPDGGIIVGGTHAVPFSDPASFTGPMVTSWFMLTRFSPTGVPDAGFGDGGTIFTNLSRGTAVRDSYLDAIVLQADGKIVAAGSVFDVNIDPSHRSRDVAVVRYLPDGRLDPGFGAAGLVVSLAPPTTRSGTLYGGNSLASAVAVDTSGRVLVGGSAMGFGTLDLAFVRYTPTGALDRSFGRSGWVKVDGGGELDGVRAVAIQPDSRALFAGAGDSGNVLVMGRLPAFAANTTVTAWGWNGLGQLGDDSTIQRNLPVVVPGSGAGAVPAAGGFHTLSLRDDGIVSAWGWNGVGQLGDGTTADHDTPRRVPRLENVTAIATGAHHSLAVSGGRVYAWGWNASGQLGDGTLVDRHTPVLVPILTDVVEVSAGAYHSLARLSDGTVWAWGWNAVGQLGDGTTTDRRRPVQVPGLRYATAISAGALHSLAAAWSSPLGSGTWAWGWNAMGQVHPLVGELIIVPDPRLVIRFRPSSISAGGFHNVVLMDDGTMHAWGWNALGQLGNGTTNYTVFAQVALRDVTSISAGLGHTLATDRNGRVWEWGWNAWGQLGDGTTTDRSRPTLTRAGTGAEVLSAGWYHSTTSRRSG